MNIQISCDDFEVTDKIKGQINEHLTHKLDQLLVRFTPEIINANLHLEQLAHTREYKASFDMHLPGKEHIYANHTHKLLLSAITGLREQLERQVEKVRKD